MAIRDHIPSFWRGVKGGYRYSASDVSRVTGIPLTTVIAHIHRGWLKGNQTHRGPYVIKVKAIREWLHIPEVAKLVAKIMIDRAGGNSGPVWYEGDSKFDLDPKDDVES